jgi:hypothetical protein
MTLNNIERPHFILSKDAYMTGTKKQKMDISKAIVESIYLMGPPGRFLKKCPATGQWSELSKRDAVDRTAQAMAYAIKGESLKQKRKDRRSRRQDDDGGTKSSQRADRPINNPSEGNNSSSSVARRSLTPRRGEAAGTNNNDVPQSASELLLPPGNSNVQQQLLQQLQQLNGTTALPIALGNSQNVYQNALTQLLSHSLQQQQLPLQYILGQNQLGQLLQSQTPLQPASLEGLTQILAQAQQQQAQQQQQHNDQHQLFLQRLLNQQNVLPSASLPASISPFLTGNLFQNLQQQANTPSNALLLSSMLNNLQQQPNPNTAISNSPHETTQQMDQLQRSLMLQQNQLLASSLGASSSNNQLPLFQQQSLQPFDQFLQQAFQATLQPQQNSQGLPPPPINSAGLISANVAAQSTGQKGSEDAVQNEPEKDD